MTVNELVADEQRRLQSLLPKTIDTLASLLDDTSPTARSSTARDILDRTLGKPETHTTLTHDAVTRSGPDNIKIVFADLDD